ncbi:MAG: hypothetical protein HYX48_01395 [Chlamydiales bacterium]|nr:hypothetical protein [Chlamydiales bacterium]
MAAPSVESKSAVGPIPRPLGEVPAREESFLSTVAYYSGVTYQELAVALDTQGQVNEAGLRLLLNLPITSDPAEYNARRRNCAEIIGNLKQLKSQLEEDGLSLDHATGELNWFLSGVCKVAQLVVELFYWLFSVSSGAILQRLATAEETVKCLPQSFEMREASRSEVRVGQTSIEGATVNVFASPIYEFEGNELIFSGITLSLRNGESVSRVEILKNADHLVVKELVCHENNGYEKPVNRKMVQLIAEMVSREGARGARYRYVPSATAVVLVAGGFGPVNRFQYNPDPNVPYLDKKTHLSSRDPNAVICETLLSQVLKARQQGHRFPESSGDYYSFDELYLGPVGNARVYFETDGSSTTWPEIFKKERILEGSDSLLQKFSKLT